MDTISKHNDDSIIWQEMIAESNELTKVAEYIKRKYPNNLDIEKVRDIVKLLVDEYDSTYEEIISGKANEKLFPMLGIKEARQESVQSKNNQEYNMPLAFKWEPKQVDKKKVQRLFMGVCLAASILVGANALVDNHIDQTNALDNISKVSATFITDKEVKGGNIVEQCMVPAGTNDGHIVWVLDQDLLVDRIITLCDQDKSLLDVYLSNIYFIAPDRLDTMDTVLLKLQERFSLNSDNNGYREYFPELYNKIKDYKYYLDYIISLGVLNPSRSDYKEIMAAIEKYKEYDASPNKSPYGTFAQLTKEEKDLIYRLRDEYQKYKNRQNYKCGDELEEMADRVELNEEFGGRPSGS